MKYTIEELRKINGRFLSRHNIHESDVEKANSFVALIESTRDPKQPKAGDRVRYTTQHGDYYGCAHIEKVRDGNAEVCEQPYVPFIFEKPDGISCNTSGGAWCGIPVDKLTYVGTEEKTFQDWGNCGAGADGTIQFTAMVSVWEYVAPDPLFGDFTTEQWRKLYVTKLDEEQRKEHSGYLYLVREALASAGNCQTAFRTEEEFQEFMDLHKGTAFPGGWPTSQVVWCYHSQQKAVSVEEWKKLELPVTQIYCNGLRHAKFKRDDEQKIVTNYFSWDIM